MPQNLSIRPMVYLLGIFQWRDHAGDLDGHQFRAAQKRPSGATTGGSLCILPACTPMRVAVSL